MLVSNRAQDARVRREPRLAAPLAREPELLEQDATQLLRGTHRELLAGKLPDLALEPIHVRRDARGELAEARGIELHTCALHPAQHLHQRQLDLFEQAAQ